MLTTLTFVFIEAVILSGALMTPFRTPLMVILLPAFFLGVDAELMALIVISVVIVIAGLSIVESRLQAAQARRASRDAAS